MNELLSEFIKIKGFFETLKQNAYCKYLYRKAIIDYDKLYQDDNTINFDDIVREKHNTINEKISDMVGKQMRDSTINFRCECVMIPHNNFTLILFYSDIDDMIEYWESLPFIEDYHYQDSTDKPKKIKKKDWNQRNIDWDEALGYELPSTVGLNYTFTDNFIKYSYMFDLVKYKLSLEIRAEKLYEHNYMKLRKFEKTYDYLDALDEFHEYKKTEKYKTELNRLMIKLNNNITFNL